MENLTEKRIKMHFNEDKAAGFILSQDVKDTVT